jgi:hypothetical protein
MNLDWHALEDAVSFLSHDSGAYLDRKTGEILYWSNPEVSGVVDDTEERVAAEPERYAAVEAPNSDEEWQWMAAFAETTEGPPRSQLAAALDGAGAFRRFKNVLLGFPEERARWFAFREEQLHAYIDRFVDALQLSVDNPPPWRLIS